MTIALPPEFISRTRQGRRIAVVGSGISGNVAALSIASGDSPADVVIYEREGRLGGHAATVDIDYDGVPISVDTGFIVYNEANYPGFTSLLDWLGVATQPSDMSFSVSAENGRFEWSGRSPGGGRLRALDSLFATRRHLVSPRFHRFIREILRFEVCATADARHGDLRAETIGDWLNRYGFSERFREDYIAPMGAAIWSMSARDLLGFPARAFLKFFDNHSLLRRERPRWRTVAGGSRRYVERISSILGDGVRLCAPIVSVKKTSSGVVVRDARGGEAVYDEVVIAAHAPQALAMLEEPTPQQRAVLGAFRTSSNAVVLHRDQSFMPRRRAAWAAWNFLKDADASDAPPMVTYWMNALQGFDPARPLFVTLNPRRQPRPETIFARFVYDHPSYDARALEAQDLLPTIQGVDGVWFCGAWTASGFHEDGLQSGLAVASALGGGAPWLKEPAWRIAAQ